MPKDTPSQTVRILGLDPGLRHTGWGVIDVTGNRLSYVAGGVIEPDASLDLAIRLKILFTGVRALVATYAPVLDFPPME